MHGVNQGRPDGARKHGDAGERLGKVRSSPACADTAAATAAAPTLLCRLRAAAAAATCGRDDEQTLAQGGDGALQLRPQCLRCHVAADSEGDATEGDVADATINSEEALLAAAARAGLLRAEGGEDVCERDLCVRADKVLRVEVGEAREEDDDGAADEAVP
jgi:hypothetical protein